MDTRDAYAALGLREGAGEDEIKAAYRALAQQYNPDRFEPGPQREDAERQMDRLNAAFDLLMGSLRGGAPAQGPAGSAPRADYRAIRQLINSGNVEQALSRLTAIPGGSGEAEWNFLMGSAYYYKGWVSQAMAYFQEACRLAPGNPEYTAALRNLQNAQEGAMPGNPYADQTPYGTTAVGCSCCDMCTAMMCMDMCCGLGRGGC